MAKFKLKFKLTGLEVEIEGDRQDAPQITAALANQLGGFLAPAAGILLEDQKPKNLAAIEAETVPSHDVPKKRKTSSRRSSPSKGGSVDTVEPISYSHDVEKYGNPHQTWSGTKKALWLLFVVNKQTTYTQTSAGVIAATFNKHFRQAGEIRPSNVSRDFGNLKTKKKPAQVGEYTESSPSQWYLTSEGLKEAEKLVSEALGEAA